MNARLLLIIPILVVSTHIVFAGTTKHIALKDGSVIVGDLVSFENGNYTIQTENLGRLQLPEANVVSIANEGVLPTASTLTSTQMPTPQQGSINNPGFSNKVEVMQNQIIHKEYVQI